MLIEPEADRLPLDELEEEDELILDLDEDDILLIELELELLLETFENARNDLNQLLVLSFNLNLKLLL